MSSSFNLALFEWMAAGYAPHPWLLPIAEAIATGVGVWACVGLIAWAAWRQPSERMSVIAGLVAAAAASLLAHAIAASVNHPRPFMLGLSPDFIAHGARGSLPSAHASVMFATAFVLLARRPLRSFGMAVAVAALATGWARIYVGVHFPLDIGAGLLLGLVVAAVITAVLALLRRYRSAHIARDDSRASRPNPDADEPAP